jgi:bacillithiol system protein YtxJ
MAHREFEHFARETNDVECWKVLVREDRSLSIQIAEDTGIDHQSPQTILFLNGKALWKTSHHSITKERLCEALSEHGRTAEAGEQGH